MILILCMLDFENREHIKLHRRAHSPTFPSLHLRQSSFSNPSSLYLRHSSFSNPSVASPTTQLVLQPFFRFSTSQALHLASRPLYVWMYIWGFKVRQLLRSLAPENDLMMMMIYSKATCMIIPVFMKQFSRLQLCYSCFIYFCVAFFHYLIIYLLLALLTVLVKRILITKLLVKSKLFRCNNCIKLVIFRVQHCVFYIRLGVYSHEQVC